VFVCSFIFPYGAFEALGVFAGILLLRKNAPLIFLSSDTATDLAVTAVISGFVGARLFYVVQFWDYFQKAPLDIFKLWQGGITFYGGVFGALLGSFIYAKLKRIHFLIVLDFLVPAIALAQGFGRIGCFLNGCCYGKLTHMPWAVTFPFLDHAVHPVQLYEAFFCFVLAFFLSILWSRKPKTGFVATVYFTLYPIGRFILEFFRGDNPVIFSGLTLPQWVSILIIVVTLFLNLYGTKRIRRSS
jgi:phosphatidylglycerol:prolipoprotein diacylglycerol transferase